MVVLAVSTAFSSPWANLVSQRHKTPTERSPATGICRQSVQIDTTPRKVGGHAGDGSSLFRQRALLHMAHPRPLRAPQSAPCARCPNRCSAPVGVVVVGGLQMTGDCRAARYSMTALGCLLGLCKLRASPASDTGATGKQLHSGSEGQRDTVPGAWDDPETRRI